MKAAVFILSLIINIAVIHVITSYDLDPIYCFGTGALLLAFNFLLCFVAGVIGDDNNDC